MLDEKILSILRTSDTYVSGEELCKLAGISRAAIWKHIEKLRGEGYEIEALPHLGYKMTAIPDRLIPSEIKWKLKTKTLGSQIISYTKIGSTNDVAYGLAEKGMKEGLVILAEEQEAGKGRQGRRWASPAKSGIYMSCILRPEISPAEIPKITLLAAVSVATAIRNMLGAVAEIKWPNDILVNHKKVCGILTEMKAEQDRVAFIVVGIGVNVNTSMKYLPRGATSLREETARDKTISRIDLVRGILQTFEAQYDILKKEGFEKIIEEWKHLTAMLGAHIKVVMAHRQIEGTAHDIDPDGSLIVRLDTGVLEKVSSGDVVMVRRHE